MLVILDDFARVRVRSPLTSEGAVESGEARWSLRPGTVTKTWGSVRRMDNDVVFDILAVNR